MKIIHLIMILISEKSGTKKWNSSQVGMSQMEIDLKVLC